MCLGTRPGANYKNVRAITPELWLDHLLLSFTSSEDTLYKCCPQCWETYRNSSWTRDVNGPMVFMEIYLRYEMTEYLFFKIWPAFQGHRSQNSKCCSIFIKCDGIMTILKCITDWRPEPPVRVLRTTEKYVATWNSVLNKGLKSSPIKLGANEHGYFWQVYLDTAIILNRAATRWPSTHHNSKIPMFLCSVTSVSTTVLCSNISFGEIVSNFLFSLHLTKSRICVCDVYLPKWCIELEVLITTMIQHIHFCKYIMKIYNMIKKPVWCT
jgi:hypothetical protein